MKLLANSAFGLLLNHWLNINFFDNLNPSLVPNQTPDLGRCLVEKYLIEQFNGLHTKCKLTIQEIPGSASPWLGNADSPSFKAAKEAIEVCIHGMAPFLYVRTKLYQWS